MTFRKDDNFEDKVVGLIETFDLFISKLLDCIFINRGRKKLSSKALVLDKLFGCKLKSGSTDDHISCRFVTICFDARFD